MCVGGASELELSALGQFRRAQTHMRGDVDNFRNVPLGVDFAPLRAKWKIRGKFTFPFLCPKKLFIYPLDREAHNVERRSRGLGSH